MSPPRLRPDQPYVPPDGFLAEPASTLKRKIRDGERRRMFAFCEEMNRFGMKALLELRARRSLPAEIYGVLFFYKALTTFQGAILLLSRGMAVESEILSRTGLECAIELAAIADDPTHVARLEEAHELHQTTYARSLKSWVPDAGEMFGPELGKAVDLAAAQPKGPDKRKISVTAQKVGMGVAYDVFHRGASGAAAHATVGAAMRHFRDEGGSPAIHIGPNFEHFPRAFAAAAHFLPVCIRAVGRIFARPDLQEAAQKFDDRWAAIIRPLEQAARK